MAEPTPLIIGAGVAGLAMALGWRQSHGVTPLICERLPAAASQGFGFLLLPRGLQALRALGVDVASELSPHPIDHVRLITPAGETLAEHGLAKGTMALDRMRLLQALGSRLDPSQLRYGYQVETLNRVESRVTTVRFRGQPDLCVDLVFGADGAVSRTRRALLERPGEPWMPGVAARVQEVVAMVDRPSLAARLGSGLLKIVVPGGGVAVGLLPLGGGNLVWFVQFDTQRHGRPSAEGALPFLERLLPAFPGWVREVIATTAPELPHHWRPLDLDPPMRLVGANIALLGDAAHPLLPFTSQGVNLALEDACLLRDLLHDTRGDAEVEAALRAYERQRLPLLRHYVAAGRLMAAHFVAPGQAEAALPVAL